MKNEGAYFWFAVVLEKDTFPKPDWDWTEIEELVKQCRPDELADVGAVNPSLLFLYDVDNLMSHYFDSNPKLRTNHIYASISKALNTAAGQPEYGFIGTKDILEGALNPLSTKLVIMANQRVIRPDVVSRLKVYIAGGGTVLLIGSNGVFDNFGQVSTAGIERLAPKLTSDQIQSFYKWGLQQDIRAPFVVIRNDGVSYFEVPFKGDPSNNYDLLRKALSRTVTLAEGGRLNFSEDNFGAPPIPMQLTGQAPSNPDTFNSPPQQTKLKPRGERDLIRDFDRNNDSVVERYEFPGPTEAFNHLDANHDGVITKFEAEMDR
jgi:hypothetical protein